MARESGGLAGGGGSGGAGGAAAAQAAAGGDGGGGARHGRDAGWIGGAAEVRRDSLYKTHCLFGCSGLSGRGARPDPPRPRRRRPRRAPAAPAPVAAPRRGPAGPAASSRRGCPDDRCRRRRGPGDGGRGTARRHRTDGAHRAAQARAAGGGGRQAGQGGAQADRRRQGLLDRPAGQVVRAQDSRPGAGRRALLLRQRRRCRRTTPSWSVGFARRSTGRCSRSSTSDCCPSSPARCRSSTRTSTCTRGSGCACASAR